MLPSAISRAASTLPPTTASPVLSTTVTASVRSSGGESHPLKHMHAHNMNLDRDRDTGRADGLKHVASAAELDEPEDEYDNSDEILPTSTMDPFLDPSPVVVYLPQVKGVKQQQQQQHSSSTAPSPSNTNSQLTPPVSIFSASLPSPTSTSISSLSSSSSSSAYQTVSTVLPRPYDSMETAMRENPDYVRSVWEDAVVLGPEPTGPAWKPQPTPRPIVAAPTTQTSTTLATTAKLATPITKKPVAKSSSTARTTPSTRRTTTETLTKTTMRTTTTTTTAMTATRLGETDEEKNECVC